MFCGGIDCCHKDLRNDVENNFVLLGIVRSSNFDVLPNLSVLKFLCSLYSEEMFSLGDADSLNEGRGCCMIF